VRVRELRAFGRNSIHLGRWDQGLGVIASGVAKAHVVGHDEDDIRQLLRQRMGSSDGFGEREGQRGRAKAERFQKAASVHNPLLEFSFPLRSKAGVWDES
jgi:hypothetical protein